MNNEYIEFGPIFDDDHEHLLGGYFAPNGDWYLTIQNVDKSGVKSVPIPFRLSLSGSQIPLEWKHKMIDLIKELPKNNGEYIESPENKECYIKLRELSKYGIKEGDIVVAERSATFSSRDYFLLSDGFPNELNTLLCCNELPNNDLHLYQLGFHWCGSEDYFSFRKATDVEKSKFIDACKKRLLEPLNDNSFWGIEYYSQILHSLSKCNDLNDEEIKEMNKGLTSLHKDRIKKFLKENEINKRGVTLLKLYEITYGKN